MNDAAICLFAWDLDDEGIDEVLAFVAELGLTSLYLASVYHAGWLVLPHNPRRKCIMPEDGLAYFHPTESFYERTPLKPRVARMAARTDWFAEVGKRLERFGLRLTAWTVCNHNTPLGLAHPEHTVRNAFGDSYPHALCPASPAVRAYLRALAKDLASHYPLRSIFLEAPNYRGRRHGHHHERVLVPLRPLEEVLLDVSFSGHDIARAEAIGIDAQVVRKVVRDHLETYLAGVGKELSGLPETMEQFQAKHPELADYLAVLDDQVATLISEIGEGLRPSGTELEGVENIPTYDVKVIGVYGKAADEVARLTREAREHCSAGQRLRVGFCLGQSPADGAMPIDGPEQARQCVQAAAENGADAVFFYNYSESAREHLRWIKPAIEGLISSD